MHYTSHDMTGGAAGSSEKRQIPGWMTNTEFPRALPVKTGLVDKIKPSL